MNTSTLTTTFARPFALFSLIVASFASAAEAPIAIGNRLELFVDRHLIQSLENVTLKIGEPRPEEIAFTFNLTPPDPPPEDPVSYQLKIQFPTN